jgi:hypothetical protein
MRRAGRVYETAGHALGAGQGSFSRPFLQEAKEDRTEKGQHRDGGDRKDPRCASPPRAADRTDTGTRPFPQGLRRGFGCDE